MSEEGLLLQSKHKFNINVEPDGTEEQMERLAAGLNNFELDENEEVEQDFYLDGDGHAQSDVTGNQIIISFSGHRKYGDPAQDFVYSLRNEVGEERKTDFEWEQPNGEVYKGKCTIAHIGGPGGDSNEKGEIEFEIHFNGKPEVTTP